MVHHIVGVIGQVVMWYALANLVIGATVATWNIFRKPWVFREEDERLRGMYLDDVAGQGHLQEAVLPGRVVFAPNDRKGENIMAAIERTDTADKNKLYYFFKLLAFGTFEKVTGWHQNFWNWRRA